MPEALLNAAKGVYVIQAFERDGVFAAFSHRKWNLKLQESENPADSKDYRDFCQSIGIDVNRLTHLEQVHGAGIALLGDSPPGTGLRIPKADAAITQIPRLAFVVRTADCAPVFFFDPKNRAAGLAHIGWKGARQGLVVKMVRTFRENFKTHPADLKVAAGPVIGACCYEVGSEFNEYFPGFIQARSGTHYFDLKGFIRRELKDAGVLSENMGDSGFCTACSNDQFFSYRLEKEAAGRMCSVMMIL